MGVNPEIKCDLCGKQFKTYSKKEWHYFEYEYYEEIRYYPLPEEKAHLVRDYICDDCYNNIGNIIKELFIEKGKKFNEDLDVRKQELFNEYQLELNKLELRDQKIKDICKVLKSNNNIYELDESVINYLKNNFPYTNGASYYLDNAIDIEKRTKQGKKRIYEWEEELLIKIESVPEPYKKSDMITKDTLKEILPDCKVKDRTLKEMLEIIKTL